MKIGILFALLFSFAAFAQNSEMPEDCGDCNGKLSGDGELLQLAAFGSLDKGIQRKLESEDKLIKNSPYICAGLKSNNFNVFLKEVKNTTSLELEEVFVNLRCFGVDIMHYVVNRAQIYEDFAWDIQDYFADNPAIDNKIFTRVLLNELNGRPLLERIRNSIEFIKTKDGSGFRSLEAETLALYHRYEQFIKDNPL